MVFSNSKIISCYLESRSESLECYTVQKQWTGNNVDIRIPKQYTGHYAPTNSLDAIALNTVLMLQIQQYLDVLNPQM